MKGEEGLALLDPARSLEPGVTLLDISMPLLNGIEAARRLRKSLPRIKLVFLTMHADRTYVAEAFRAGASAYLLKRAAVSEPAFAIHEVLKGRYYVAPLVAHDLVDFFVAKTGCVCSRTFRRTTRNNGESRRNALQE